MFLPSWGVFVESISNTLRLIFMVNQFHFFQIHLHNMHYIKQCAECLLLNNLSLPTFAWFSSIFPPLNGKKVSYVCVYIDIEPLWDSPYIFRQYSQVNKKKNISTPYWILSYSLSSHPWQYFLIFLSQNIGCTRAALLCKASRNGTVAI